VRAPYVDLLYLSHSSTRHNSISVLLKTVNPPTAIYQRNLKNKTAANPPLHEQLAETIHNFQVNLKWNFNSETSTLTDTFCSGSFWFVSPHPWYFFYFFSLFFLSPFIPHLSFLSSFPSYLFSFCHNKLPINHSNSPP
jgi:hypothetical protein